MRDFLLRRWFLIGLALAIGVGMGCSGPLRPVSQWPALRQGVLVCVMFLMAFPLRATAMWDALRHPRAPLLAILVNYGLLPLAAWGLAWTLWISPETRYGLLVTATTPCTLASAAVWTRRAGGNDAVAIVVMVVTNFACFLVTPAWLYAMLGQAPDLDIRGIVVPLAVLVVLPMVVAQGCRRVGTLGAWASEHRSALGVLAQIGVLTMVWLGSIQTGNKLAGSTFATVWWDTAQMLVAVVGLHVAMLATGMALARGAGCARPEAIAVGIAGSQKTLMVGLEICAQFGITMLPMVAYHVGQLLLDTLIADRLRKS